METALEDNNMEKWSNHFLICDIIYFYNKWT